MSEQQLKRAQNEKEKLQEELNNCKNIIKVSEACESLKKYVLETSDPFNPDYSGDNPWHSKAGSGDCCSLM